jgi:hypothetical protein
MNVRSSSRTGPWKISIARSHTSGFVTHFGNANDSCAYTVNGLTLLAVAASMAWTSSRTSTSWRIQRCPADQSGRPSSSVINTAGPPACAPVGSTPIRRGVGVAI